MFPMPVMKNFYLVDCSYHFRASFFALPPIYTPDGRLVNAVYGFVSMLLRLLKKYTPDAWAIAEDAPRPYFRHQLFPQYKSEKVRAPEECDQQMPILLQVLDAMNIPHLSAEGFEADDVIATLARTARANGYRIYICSKDKDLHQVLADLIVILDVSSGEELTVDKLREIQGISPEQVPDVLALTGDKADSIPGVPGIGLKTAAALLTAHTTLGNVLDHSDTIGGKVGERLGDYRDQVLLARKLATLRTDVPIPTEIEQYQVRLPFPPRLRPLFEELGFQRLLERLEQINDRQRVKGGI